MTVLTRDDLCAPRLSFGEQPEWYRATQQPAGPDDQHHHPSDQQPSHSSFKFSALSWKFRSIMRSMITLSATRPNRAPGTE